MYGFQNVKNWSIQIIRIIRKNLIRIDRSFGKRINNDQEQIKKIGLVQPVQMRLEMLVECQTKSWMVITGLFFKRLIWKAKWTLTIEDFV